MYPYIQVSLQKVYHIHTCILQSKHCFLYLSLFTAVARPCIPQKQTHFFPHISHSHCGDVSPYTITITVCSSSSFSSHMYGGICMCAGCHSAAIADWLLHTHASHSLFDIYPCVGCVWTITTLLCSTSQIHVYVCIGRSGVATTESIFFGVT